MSINFNVDPYFDDYSEDDKFLRILFRPGYSVQARELTQIQSILQNQISRHADHMFSQGAMVIPGQISYEDKFQYVTVQPIFNGSDVDGYLDDILGKELIGNSSGVRAFVVHIEAATSSDPTTIYVRYNKSGEDSQGNITSDKTFINAEILTCEDTISGTPRGFNASLADATGTGTGVSLERGIYYIDKYFVLAESQKITLDKYTTTPSYRVGLNIIESIVTPEEDTKLLDNARGTSNFTAPGAHRYKINLVLSSRAVDSVEDKNFIELLRVLDGKIVYKTRTTDYSVLESTLARRTYDESGDYVINNFTMDVREHRDNNRGTWEKNTDYLVGDVVTYQFGPIVQKYVAASSGTSGSQPPIHSTGKRLDGLTGIEWMYKEYPWYNRGIHKPEAGGDESKLAIGLEPGKAYVRGYEIEKIGTTYVDVDKPREFTRLSEAQIDSTIGNYIQVTRLHGAPRIDKFELVDLYDRFVTTDGSVPSGANKIGTARVRGIELFDRGASRDADIFNLQVVDVKINPAYDMADDLKAFHNSNFTCDINPIVTRITGSLTASNSTTVNGNGTLFQTEVIVGDWIYLGSSSARRRVVSIQSDTQITVDANVTVTGVVSYRLTVDLYEPENSSLLFPLSFLNVRNVRFEDDITIRTTYEVTQVFQRTASSAVGDIALITIDSIGVTDSFLPAADADNYLLIDLASGDAVFPQTVQVVEPQLRQVIFSVDSQYADNDFIVYAGVKKTGLDAKEKTKTLVSNFVKEVTVQASAKAKEISLGVADVYNLVSIKMAPAFGAIDAVTNPATTDIFDYYEIDNNITDSYYGISKLVLKQGYPAPTGSLSITFDYFDHGPGDYFSVDSYDGAGIRFESIPSYNGFSLRDLLDFRPRMDETGVAFDTVAGAVLSQIPKRGANIQADFSYYTARKDKISLDFSGKFFVTKGTPSVTPIEPQTPQGSMLLYKLDLRAYTFSTAAPDVSFETIDNKRYTMRDIGKLEKRIDNLEYYTSLSMLESETSNASIKDEAGLDRFKNGFIVDDFSGHGIGDSSSADYRCSIDMEQGELRPFYRMENVNLIERNSNNAQRTTDKYQVTGDLITLPYTTVPLINQSVASRTENVNPFAIFTFLGRVELNPSGDEWFEIERRPDIVNNVEGSFSTISALAEKAGVLGTVWNSWQTQWTGAPAVNTNIINARFGGAGAAGRDGVGPADISPDALNAQFGNGPDAPGWAFRRVTVQTSAQQVGQSRSGIKSTVVANVERKVVDDKILSTAVIPYIRSRNILFSVHGLKPSTNFWAYFDSASVSEYVTPASKIVFNEVAGFSSTFDSSSAAGSSSGDASRRLANDPKDNVQVALNRGDIIVGQTSGATAVVVGTEYSEETGQRSVYVLNIKGAFQLNETFVGSISLARGSVVSTTLKSKGDRLVTTINGNVYGLFDIPNTGSVRFRTGVREFKLMDSAVLNVDFTSVGSTTYSASGILQVKQQTIEAVRNGMVVQENVTESRTITQTAERVVGDTGWYDPLAQTFLVQQKGGAFLTSVDLYFATKDKAIPVKVEIREVVNGYPGKKILPFSQVVLNPQDVKLSSRNVVVAGQNNKIVPAPDTPTKFTFPSPVYVQDATEYCVVIISDSNNYNLWVAQMGDKIPGTDRFVSEQPYNGVFFKSQNASTWTADDYKDLAFVIHRAKFETNVVGRVEFSNDELPKTTLENDPIQTAAASNMIRVFHENHNMPVSSKVKLSGFVTGTSYNGLTAANLNATHTIEASDLDSYTITLDSGTATSSGFTGGTGKIATDNILMTALQPIIQVQSFSDTTTEYDVYTTSGQSPDGSEVPYLISERALQVVPNQTNYFDYPQVVASAINEEVLLNNAKSFTLRASIKTTNESVSPVIDTHRTSLIAIHNKVNDATQVNTNISVLDDVVLVSANTNVAFTTTGLSTSNSTVKTAFKNTIVGRYVRVGGSSISANNGTFLVTGIAEDGSTITLANTFSSQSASESITVTDLTKYIDDIAPTNGTQYSKYFSKRVDLKNPSTFLNIKFAANVPNEAGLDVYYRLNKVGSSNLDSSPYILLAPDVAITKSSGGNSFTDITYSAKDLQAFDGIQVKLVFRSSNSCKVPLVKDLRITACA
jgi:hypothetical protein